MPSRDEASVPRFQTAIVQGCEADATNRSLDALPLVISHQVAVPPLDSAYHVRVKVLAVALNHCDYKMVQSFPVPGNMVGCDFCGIIVDVGTEAVVVLGARVCGAAFPYGRQCAADVSGPRSGAFAQFVVADSRLLLRVPEAWSDGEGAALGGVGWCTVALALSAPDALALSASPSQPAKEKVPVLVYGGATATGTMACQLLMLSGFAPLAVTSPQSAALALAYGASGTASYTLPTCTQTLRHLAGDTPIRHALDCIISAESVATCFAALARTGGRYACLEALPDGWRTRRAVRTKEVMGYEAFGLRAQLGQLGQLGPGPSPDPCDDATRATMTYSRDANPAALATCARWAIELQALLDAGLLKNHPIREIDGLGEGVIAGVHMLRAGEVRGLKLVARMG
ncbi:putative zinc binding dehydrogenase [Xylaria cf. heliscus]|nr:putative zinc binding dehydrogenase [Xylaria cf. heliscus]